MSVHNQSRTPSPPTFRADRVVKEVKEMLALALVAIITAVMEMVVEIRRHPEGGPPFRVQVLSVVVCVYISVYECM